MKFIISLTFIGAVLLSLAGNAEARPQPQSKGDEENPPKWPVQASPVFDTSGMTVAVSQNPELAPVGELNYTVVAGYTYETPNVPAFSHGFDTNGVVVSVSGNPAETPVGQPSTTVSMSYELPDGTEIQVSSDEIGFQPPAAGQTNPTVGEGYIVGPDDSVIPVGGIEQYHHTRKLKLD